ncbi:MAG: HAD-IA family hydrolase [Candidatus Neomarinimicrobiota bacterium]|nr:HAD-IA family hydrolase [Candidatus Neomarinimicrobiota bacterium]
MINAIIFDLDNTLLDFMNMKRQAITAAVDGMVEAGLNIDTSEAYDSIMVLYESGGWENQEIFNDFLESTTGEVNHKFLAAGIVAYRRARDAALTLYPGVQKTLITLSKMGLKLAIVSDAPRREAWLRICYLNLHHFFDLVLTFDDVGERKPSPKGFEMALSEFGLISEKVLMVGDWPERDMEGAHQLGIRTIFAKYGDTFGTVESGADWEVEDIFEIVSIVKSLNGA